MTMTTTTETRPEIEKMDAPVVNVYNNHGQWVGSFYNARAAATWISTRAVPEVFEIRTGRKDDTTPVAQGIYPAKSDKRLADADEYGFLADKPWPKAKGAAREAKVEVPLHSLGTSRGDDAALDRAIRESLATDKTDDNSRPDIGLDVP